jgi:hypothetical protein
VKGETIDSLLAKGDAIGALCLAVEQAGGRMTLYGTPIDTAGLRDVAAASVVHRLEQLIAAGHDPGDEDRSESVLGDEL